jgi:hypothetical protein
MSLRKPTKEQFGFSRHSHVRAEKSLRFGLGEYENIDDDGAGNSRQDLRSLFLHTASKAKPELASELEDLLGLYSQIPLFCYTADKKRRNTRGGGKRYSWSSHCRPKWKYIEDAWQQHMKMRAKSSTTKTHFKLKFDDYYDVYDRNGTWWSSFDMPPHTDHNIEQFILTLFNWSNKYRLNATWCRQFAYETLDLWSQSETYRKARIWWYTTAHVSSSRLRKSYSKLVMLLRAFEPLPQELVFKWTTFYPVQGFRGAEKKLISAKFGEELDTFLDRCEQQAQDANLVRSVRKNTREHLQWLVDFQVKQMDYNEIRGTGKSRKTSPHSTQSSGDETKTVRQAINQLAKLIELPLRDEPRRPGRPPSP